MAIVTTEISKLKQASEPFVVHTGEERHKRRKLGPYMSKFPGGIDATDQYQYGTVSPVDRFDTLGSQ